MKPGKSLERFREAYAGKEDAQILREAVNAIDDQTRQAFAQADEAGRQAIVDRLLHAGEIAHAQQLVLSEIAANPSGPWSEDTWRIIRASEGQEWLFRAIAEAIRNGGGRKPMLEPEEIWLIDRWDAVTIGTESLPGLRVWTWTAIAAIAEAYGHTANPGAWRKIAARAGLVADPKPAVRQFAAVLDSIGRPQEFVLTLKGGQKKYVRP